MTRKLVVLGLSLFLLNSTCFAEQKAKAKPAVDSPAKIAPISPEDQQILNAGRIENGPYIAGGVIGTLMGLGIGQGIQGRYSQIGWVFTLGELAFATLLVVDVATHTSEDVVAAALGANGNTYQISALGVVGLAGIAGFRIWEIIDVWATPPAQNAAYDRVQERVSGRPRTSLSLIPVAMARNVSSPGLTLGLSF